MAATVGPSSAEVAASAGRRVSGLCYQASWSVWFPGKKEFTRGCSLSAAKGHLQVTLHLLQSAWRQSDQPVLEQRAQIPRVHAASIH